MKKMFCMIAFAAISFGSVYAHGTTTSVKAVMQTDTTKKKKPVPPPKPDTIKKKKKDTLSVKQN